MGNEQQPDQEIAEPKRKLGVEDLIRYFVAGQIVARPDIDKAQVQTNVEREFKLEDGGVLILGQWPSLSIWINPRLSDELEARFGGGSITQLPDISEPEAISIGLEELARDNDRVFPYDF